jgi:hypothetical protein
MKGFPVSPGVRESPPMAGFFVPVAPVEPGLAHAAVAVEGVSGDTLPYERIAAML